MNEKLNNDFFLLNEGYSNYEDTTDLARHRWYYYKEGFSPNLVEKAIEKVGVKKDDLIIDPFNGSGTTTLTASILGYQSLGIEVNPFTAFLSNVKLSNVDATLFENWSNKLFIATDRGKASPLLRYSTFSRSKGIDKWLFNDSVLNSFEGGWNLTERIPSYNIRRLFKLALIITAMQNCNAKRDGKCLRYREGWENNGFNKDTFVLTLILNLMNMQEDILQRPITGRGEIVNADCRKYLSSNAFDSYRLCITSPPYLNTFDYTDIYRPELFLGKFIPSSEALYKLRLKTVRSHVQAKWNDPIKNDFGALYNQSMDHLNDNLDNLMHKNIPLMVQAYFEDISNILGVLKQKAKRNGQVWFVVSNSAYANKEIPVDLIIGDIASRLGWYLKEIGVLRYLKKRKTKYSRDVNELRESVIILSKSKF